MIKGLEDHQDNGCWEITIKKSNNPLIKVQTLPIAIPHR